MASKTQIRVLLRKADGIIVKSRGSVSLTGAAAKVSTGAVAYVPVAVVSNLSQAISECKDAGYWVVASDGGATKSYEEVDYHGPILLVIGSEGFGISRLVLERSDFVVKIPMELENHNIHPQLHLLQIVMHLFYLLCFLKDMHFLL